MKRLLMITVVGVLASGMRTAELSAQLTPESRAALIVGMSGRSHGPVGAFGPTFGMSMRIWRTKQSTGRLSGFYSIPLSTGSRVCVENPCDTRRLRDEYRISTDVRRVLGSTALFTHFGVGVSGSRITGETSQRWEEWGKGDRRTPLGFGQLGIGVRSRRAQRTRWAEAGIERRAASSLTGAYLRVGLGIL